MPIDASPRHHDGAILSWRNFEKTKLDLPEIRTAKENMKNDLPEVLEELEVDIPENKCPEVKSPEVEACKAVTTKNKTAEEKHEEILPEAKVPEKQVTEAKKSEVDVPEVYISKAERPQMTIMEIWYNELLNHQPDTRIVKMLEQTREQDRKPSQKSLVKYPTKRNNYIFLTRDERKSLQNNFCYDKDKSRMDSNGKHLVVCRAIPIAGCPSVSGTPLCRMKVRSVNLQPYVVGCECVPF